MLRTTLRTMLRTQLKTKLKIVLKKALRLLFPKEYREFEQKRFVIVVLRSLHIMCFSILVGGYYFHQDQSLLMQWFLGALFSGVAMFLIDMYGSCVILFEVRGISILFKLFILAWIPVLNSNYQIVSLLFVIVLSSYISHTTGKIRHKNVLPESLQKRLASIYAQ